MGSLVVGGGGLLGHDLGDDLDEVLGDMPEGIVEVAQLAGHVLGSVGSDALGDPQVHVAVDEEVGVDLCVVGFSLLHIASHYKNIKANPS